MHVDPSCFFMFQRCCQRISDFELIRKSVKREMIQKRVLIYVSFFQLLLKFSESLGRNIKKPDK